MPNIDDPSLQIADVESSCGTGHVSSPLEAPSGIAEAKVMIEDRRQHRNDEQGRPLRSACGLPGKGGATATTLFADKGHPLSLQVRPRSGAGPA